jgi:hypothetical protein
MSPRLTAVSAAHAGCARLAAATASSTSAEVDRATRQISRPVAGSILANVPASTAGASAPATRFGMTAGIADRSTRSFCDSFVTIMQV